MRTHYNLLLYNRQIWKRSASQNGFECATHSPSARDVTLEKYLEGAQSWASSSAEEQNHPRCSVLELFIAMTV